MSRSKGVVLLLLCFCMIFTGCVNQKQGQPTERTAVSGSGTIVATSVSIVQICDKLGLDLVGVPKSDLAQMPERYKSATVVGSPMSPDMEILSQVSPEWVLSPSSLQSDLQPKYDAVGVKYGFLNLKSVLGMYKSISDMGELFGCQERANQLVAEFEEYYQNYQASHQDKPSPTVLILMGLPGSYVVATENSYVGSLVEMAGGRNVYAGTKDEFLNVNTEDMLKKNPDVILRTAHAMPESVMEMFAEEFRTNDIWKHFSAVQNNQVYDLPHECFGMSANFKYPEALAYLDELLYRNPLITGGM